MSQLKTSKLKPILSIKMLGLGRLSSMISYTPIGSDESNSDLSSDTESDAGFGIIPPLLRPQTTMSTKIKKIKDRTTPTSLPNKKKIKNNKSLKDWWIWYWQAPIARLPFFYFLITLLFSISSCIYWFMDNDSAFISCGIIGLPMCIYAIYKFRISIKLKQQVDYYRTLNVKFKHENRTLEGCIQRAERACDMLRQTRTRLAKANNKNRRNLKKFSQVENSMKIAGKKAFEQLKDVSSLTKDIREEWRNKMLENERAMLYAVFNRYETTHGNTTSPGLNEMDFLQFKTMLPERYQERFDRCGTFHCFSGDNQQVHYDDFVNALDTFALMETDDRDIEVTLTSTPSSSYTDNATPYSFVQRIQQMALPSIRERSDSD